MRRAVIDIGTNTVKLLVADLQNGVISPVVSMDTTTRLGRNVNATRRLSPLAMEGTVEAVEAFAAEARSLGAARIVALATSAARDAINCGEFLDAVRRRCGLNVEVVTGEREAELIFRGASSDPTWATERVLVMDVGGGSAEFILGKSGVIERWKSLSLGAVRLTEQFNSAGFAELAEFVRRTLHDALAEYDRAGWRLIATGGTNVTLARVAKGEVDRAVLSQEEVRVLVSKLNAMTLDERRCVPGLPPERADIIVAGGAVTLFAMEILGAREATVSVRGLRHGALL